MTAELAGGRIMQTVVEIMDKRLLVVNFPIVKPEEFEPKRLTIDFRNGEWSADIFLQNGVKA